VGKEVDAAEVDIIGGLVRQYHLVPEAAGIPVIDERNT
jgi:hypothetical protein